MKKIMFVCSGNICRSPMAHVYMKKKVEELGFEDEIFVDSCGVFAYTGEKATDYAKEAIIEYGADLSNFEATNIKDTKIYEYDLVFGLTEKHKEIILSLYPMLEGKVFTLKEYADEKNKYIDIDDPWGLSLEVYKKCAKEIVENVDKIIKKI